jgi:3-methyladenine DNA glycosylase AlkD
MKIAEVVAALRAGFVAQGSAARAVHEQKYLKSDLTFLGVTQPQIRVAARSFAREHADLDHASLKALVEALWRTRTHELRSVAIGILERRLDLLRPADADWLIGLVDQANTWAHVDWLAVKVVGGLLQREAPAGRGAGGVAGKLDRWAQHANFWVRRTALLALHDPLLAGGGDFDHFARLAAGLLHEREFFIRKAIGWVLRSTAKRTPARTAAFVAAHAPAMSGLTFREATRALSAKDQKRLQALRTAGAEKPEETPAPRPTRRASPAARRPATRPAAPRAKPAKPAPR